MMKTPPSSRLFKTLAGHHHELLAVLARTSAHKLPGAKGAARERAVAKFLRTWLQARYSVPTNVFATTRDGKECPGELDLVIHDGNTGAVWPLDDQGGNSVVTWEEVRLIVQIKSTLDEKTFAKACQAMSRLNAFWEELPADAQPRNKPPAVLFAYQVDDEFLESLLEKFVYSRSDAFPFEAFVLLEQGAYLSDSLRDLRLGIENGLSPDRVGGDRRAVNRMVQEDCIESRIPNGYRVVRDPDPEQDRMSEMALLTLATLATLTTSGHDVTQALLAACVPSEYQPLFE